jgi:hypothetical protein
MSDDLRAVGDQMQSAASRLAEFVSSLKYATVPYEVACAVYEAERSVQEWTALRRRDALPAGVTVDFGGEPVRG